MRFLGIRARLAIAIALAASIPVVTAMVFARAVVQQASERYFVPEIREHLDRALLVYGELAKTTKASMRHEAAALAGDAALRAAVHQAQAQATEDRLRQLLALHPGLVSLSVVAIDGNPLATVTRGRPVDEGRENQLSVVRPLLPNIPPPASAEPVVAPRGPADDDEEADEGADEASQSPAPELVALFAVSRVRFDEFTAMGEFIDLYAKLAERRLVDERTYLWAFAAILGGTIVIALAAGALVSRSVIRRVSDLAEATHRVASGDLSIRVAETPGDEVGALGAAFNRMLGEVEASRNRIEYLSRLASWQEMARRLAHEIKNPLTPIQLAVQEVHRRLVGLPDEHRRLLDITLEVVEAEVLTLRRLVTEFSQFARLPESHIEPGDLRQFLVDLEREATARGDFFLDLEADAIQPNLSLAFSIPRGPAPLAFDAQMLRRVAVNLIRNAGQACKAVGGRIRVSAQQIPGGYELCFDDDGPGVPPASRSQIFEPYMTTKDDGTGLGLAIVKKIVMDHEGDVEMLASPLGGARVRIVLPMEGSR